MLNVVYFDEHDLSFQLDDEKTMIQELELKIVAIKQQQYQRVLMVAVKQLLRSIDESKQWKQK
jgi:hypothetical protein